MHVTQTAPMTPSKMPKLDRSNINPELAALSKDWAKRVEARNAAFAEAVKARSFADRFSPAELEEARRKDQAALVEGAKQNPPSDPGRLHEMEFLAEAEAAHRQAEAATVIANEATTELRKAMIESGPNPSDIADRIKELEATKRKHADVLVDVIAEAESLRALRETFRRIDRGSGYEAIPSGSTRSLEINGHGQGLRATLAAEQLADLDLGAES